MLRLLLGCLQAATAGPPGDETSVVRARTLSEDGAHVQVVVRDGAIDAAASSILGLPPGTFIGPIASAPADAAAQHLVRRWNQGGTPAPVVDVLMALLCRASSGHETEGHHPICTQGQLSQRLGRTFALLNGATAQDALCIAVPNGVQLEQPIHIIYMTTGIAGLLELAGLCL